MPAKAEFSLVSGSMTLRFACGVEKGSRMERVNKSFVCEWMRPGMPLWFSAGNGPEKTAELAGPQQALSV